MNEYKKLEIEIIEFTEPDVLEDSGPDIPTPVIG